MNVPSTLDAITVYREGAVCQRKARLEPVDGKTPVSVRVVGLPLSALPGTLRARVSGEGPRVLDVRAALDVQLSAEGDVPERTRALEAAREALAKLQLREAHLAEELEQLSALRPAFREPKEGDPPREAAVGTMLALADFVSSRLDERLSAKRALAHELEDAAEQVRLCERRVAEASTAERSERAKLSRAAQVTLSEPSAGPVELVVEYQVPGVRWVPSYDLRLVRDLSSGSLRLRAQVAQDTGEDWVGVALSLSTASLSRRADAPELKALKLGRTQPPPPRSGWREPPAGLEELFGAYDDAVRALAPPADFRPVMPAAERPAPRAGKGAADKAAVREDRKERKKEAAPSLARRPAARPSMAPGAAGGMPPAAPPPAPMAAAPMSVPPTSVAASAMAVGRAQMMDQDAPRRSRRDAEELYAGAAELEEAAASDELALADEAPMRSEAVDAGPRLDEGRLDYDRLVLPDSLVAGQRGRLAPAPEQDLLFLAQVSVRVDVVVMKMNEAQRRQHALSQLSVPPLCRPPQAVDAFDFRYDCAQRVDVPSTGRWVMVPVSECRVELVPEMVCVPAVEPRVYRTLLIKNAGAQALLPGPVDVSAGEEFLVTAVLPAVPPGSAAERLGLGVEEAIKVSRKTDFKETTGGFLGGTTVLAHGIEVELNNRLASAVRVEVRERVPFVPPSEKDLKVEEDDVAPAWEKVETVDGEPAQGMRRWRVTAPPGEKIRLSARFNVRMPGDQMLAGGNRRV